MKLFFVYKNNLGNLIFLKKTKQYNKYMSLKLYAPLGNPRGSKVLIASELANVEV